MSTGTYFPPPVRAVEIPKNGDGVRVLGVPTVGDRIAQSVVARVLEVAAEPVFHPDSYGYRPGRSALDAVAVCRRRCWKAAWVIDLDIAAFFDTVRWDLVLKAVAVHSDQPWVMLYVQRWLSAPLQRPDGTRQARDRGTPQGSSVSPILANLFLHYAFDAWMAREFPTTTFERYVDDVVVHCHSEREANRVLAAIRERMSQVGLTLHPEKTKIVYCQDDNRREDYEHVEFTFLGYTFTERSAQSKDGTMFRSFLPAISKNALKRISPGAVLAAAPPHPPFRSGPRTLDQPDRAGLDELLRSLLQVGPVSPAGTHQRLPDAVDPKEIQTVAEQEESPGRLEPSRHTTTPVLRPLGLDHLPTARLVTRTTRAV